MNLMIIHQPTFKYCIFRFIVAEESERCVFSNYVERIGAWFWLLRNVMYWLYWIIHTILIIHYVGSQYCSMYSACCALVNLRKTRMIFWLIKISFMLIVYIKELYLKNEWFHFFCQLFLQHSCLWRRPTPSFGNFNINRSSADVMIEKKKIITMKIAIVRKFIHRILFYITLLMKNSKLL